MIDGGCSEEKKKEGFGLFIDNSRFCHRVPLFVTAFDRRCVFESRRGWTSCEKMSFD